MKCDSLMTAEEIQKNNPIFRVDLHPKSWTYYPTDKGADFL